MSIEWTGPAVGDLEALAEFIARDDPGAAEAVVREILQGVERLERFPGLGRPGRVAGTRELVAAGGVYVVVYEERAPGVLILRVLHAAQAWPRP